MGETATARNLYNNEDAAKNNDAVIRSQLLGELSQLHQELQGPLNPGKKKTISSEIARLEAELALLGSDDEEIIKTKS